MGGGGNGSDTFPPCPFVSLIPLWSNKPLCNSLTDSFPFCFY